MGQVWKWSCCHILLVRSWTATSNQQRGRQCDFGGQWVISALRMKAGHIVALNLDCQGWPDFGGEPDIVQEPWSSSVPLYSGHSARD